ncbi:MAG: mevalonate kinase [Bacteroidetes bacterium]|nr:mevalonate kinase [Bacteroidota bacterium]
MSEPLADFNSKILLFGEYGVIHNAMALSIPFDEFAGRLTFEPSFLNEIEAKKSNQSLKKYAAHLSELIEFQKLPFVLDIETFERDIEAGLVFDSSIPQGFGVGSSGALVAAVYDRYALEKISNSAVLSGKDTVRLKESLARMESFFHGKSSGMDPLICYLRQPMLIESKDNINKVGLPESKLTGKAGIFLLNTGKPGNTQPLVNLFLDKCKEEGFLAVVKQEIIPFSDNCIKAFLKGEAQEMFENLKELSALALSYLNPMIPRRFRKVWKKGLDTQSYYLKLCGSGGGGYLLGFAEDLDKAQAELHEHELKIIHRF